MTNDTDYEAIIKEMHRDMNRTRRQREVEACFGEPLPTILENTYETAESKAGVVRRLNDALASNGYDDSLSRPTLYSWMKDYGVGEYGDEDDE